MRITFLGTGTSTGIPMIGCNCAVCQSSDPRDKRTRTSAVVNVDDKALLIDTAPELRLQSIAAGLKRIDAVLYTHAHADHVAGFDDLRSFNVINQAKLDVYTDSMTADLIRGRFEYAFERPFPFYGGKPDLNIIVHEGQFTVNGTSIEITPIPVRHGRWTVYGFRIRNLVYVTDVKEIPESSLDLLRDASVLVINALRHEPHPVHLSLDQALEVIHEVRPRRAFLVHISHGLPHAATNRRLPDHVRIAYDGQVVEIDC